MKKSLRKLLLGGMILLNGNGGQPINNVSPEQRIERARTELATAGITTEQRAAYKPGVSEIAYRTITPYGYVPNTRELWQDFKQNISDPDHRVQNVFQLPREDAWRLYLGLPQRFDTFEISDYQPAQSKEKKYYYKMQDFWGHYLDFLMRRNRLSKVEDAIRATASIAKIRDPFEAEVEMGFEARRDELYWGMGVMGRFNLSTGEDERGHYISYYDKWDLSVGPEKDKGFIGKPFEIYDRIYYDPETFKPKEPLMLARWDFANNQLYKFLAETQKKGGIKN